MGEWRICFTKITARVRRSIVHAALRKVWKCFHIMLIFTLSIKSHISHIAYQMYTLSHVIYIYIYHIFTCPIYISFFFFLLFCSLFICHMYIYVYHVYTWCIYMMYRKISRHRAYHTSILALFGQKIMTTSLFFATRQA